MTRPTQPRGAVVRRVVAAPAERAWAVLTDLRRHEDWIPATELTVPDELAVGDEVVAVSGLRVGGVRRGLADRMVVERIEPPVTSGSGPGRTGVLALQKIGPVLLGPTEIRVRPLGPGHSEVTWVEQIHLRGPGRLWRRTTAALLGPPFTAMLRLALTHATPDLSEPGRGIAR